MTNKKPKIINEDSIWYMYRDSKGMHYSKERAISPNSQKEADQIYKDLDNYLHGEYLYQDGEASDWEAEETFKFYMTKAKTVERFGYLPTQDGEWWKAGDRPSLIKWEN